MARLSGTGRLADDLYLLAHHEVTGKPHLQPRAAGLGLAGALLAELMLSGKIYLRPGRIIVADRSPPRDGLAQSVLRLVVSEPGQLAARDWLLFLARTTAEDVALRLEQSGYLTRISPRRPWRGERWIPVDSDCAFAPLLRVKSALDSSQPVTAQNAALAGLAAACAPLATRRATGSGERFQTFRRRPGFSSRAAMAPPMCPRPIKLTSMPAPSIRRQTLRRSALAAG